MNTGAEKPRVSCGGAVTNPLAAMKGGERVEPPFADQRFDSFGQWVSRASSWLTCHHEYNNTEHGEKKGWRGSHFTALCFDSLGRRCRCGKDMMRARDEGAFPVWWIWPDQIADVVRRFPLPPASAEEPA